MKLVNVKENAFFVLFEGADKLPHGHYGTSIPIELAVSTPEIPPSTRDRIFFEENFLLFFKSNKIFLFFFQDFIYKNIREKFHFF